MATDYGHSNIGVGPDSASSKTGGFFYEHGNYRHSEGWARWSGNYSDWLFAVLCHEDRLDVARDLLSDFQENKKGLGEVLVGMSESDILPSSLTKTPKVDVSMSRDGAVWLYLFCANCGVDSGYRVRETWLPKQFAFYLCDDCVQKYGAPAAMMMEPDMVFWKRVAEIQIEEFGHILSDQELVVQLDDLSSSMSKLERDRRRDAIHL